MRDTKKQNKKLPKYDGVEFFDNRRKQYRDKARDPLFVNNEVSFANRKNIVKNLPHKMNDGYIDPTYDTVFAPFAQSAEPLLLSGANEGAWNCRYGPFTAIFLVLREYTNDFYSMVDGYTVASQQDYNELQERFNDIWSRILNGKGRGPGKGTCSVDEMVRIGSLFYILQKASGKDEGISINQDKEYNGNWSGDKTVIDFDKSTLKQYQKKIDDTYFSDILWNKFMMRYIPTTDENTLWFIRLPELTSDFYISRKNEVESFEWFDIRALSRLIELFKPIDERGGKLFMYFPQSEDMIHHLKKNFSSVMEMSSGRYTLGDEFFLYESVGKTAFPYTAVSNYKLPNERII